VDHHGQTAAVWRSRTGTLAFILVLGLVAIVSFQAWLLVGSRSNDLEQIAVRAANRAQANANQLTAVFRQIDLVLLDLRDHISAEDVRRGPAGVGDERRQAIDQLIRQRMQRLPLLANLHVIDAEGRFVYSSAETGGQSRVDDRPYFIAQQHATADEMVVSPPLFGRVVQRWSVFCSRRLTAPDGSFVGVLLTGIDAGMLAQEMQAVDQKQWVLALVHDSQLLAARQPADERLIGQRITAADSEWLASGVTASFRGPALGEEQPGLWASMRVARLPLTAVAGYGEEHALQQWNKDLHTHFAATALVMAGIVALLLLQRWRERTAAMAATLDRRLRNSELALAGIVRRVPVGVFRLGVGHGTGPVLAYASPRCNEIIGSLPDSEDSVMAVVHEDDRYGFSAALRSAARTSEFGWSGRIRRGGQIRWLDVRVSSASGSGEWDGVVQDITQRREAEQELQRQQELMLAVFNHAPVGIVLCEPDNGLITFANPAASGILGPGLVGRGLAAIISPQDIGRIHASLQRARLAGALPERLTTAARTDGGRHLDLDVVITAIQGGDGRAMNGMAVFHDITEERRLAAQIRQAEKMQAVGLLAGGIAHDFNNILAGIAGFADLARKRQPPEPVASHLEQIAAAADRAKTLVRQILTFSRRDGDERRPIHLQSTIREVLNLLRATLPSSVEMDARLDQDVAPVLADAGRIHQVVMNLCTNAVHAMQGKGELHLSLAQVELAVESRGRLATLPAGTYARLEVGDTGCGMDARTLERIFDPFFTTKGPNEGTGLGLAVVWGVVSSHGGDIQVTSRPGAGTTFTILLPVIARVPSDPSSAPVLSTAVPRGSERILVVDDEPALRAVFSESLGDLGYQVSSCANGQEALSAIRTASVPFDLVVTDQTMPGMTGTELIAAAGALRPGLPFIICSGMDCTLDERTRKSGRVSFCMEPVNLDHLARLARTALDARRS